MSMTQECSPGTATCGARDECHRTVKRAEEWTLEYCAKIAEQVIHASDTCSPQKAAEYIAARIRGCQ